MKRSNIEVKSSRTYVNELPPGPDLIDHEIEAEDYRARFDEDEAVVCIGVQPGDEELGQFFVNVQLEAKSGRGKPEREAVEHYNQCIQKQGALLEDTAGWLADILGEFDADWEVDIAAMPCPKATKEIKLQAVANRLENKVERSRTEELQPTVPVPVANKVKS